MRTKHRSRWLPSDCPTERVTATYTIVSRVHTPGFYHTHTNRDPRIREAKAVRVVASSGRLGTYPQNVTGFSGAQLTILEIVRVLQALTSKSSSRNRPQLLQSEIGTQNHAGFLCSLRRTCERFVDIFSSCQV
jgi:hypothetical protein